MTPTRWLAAWWPRWWKRLALAALGVLLLLFAWQQLAAWTQAREAARWRERLDGLTQRRAADSTALARLTAQARWRDTVYRADTVRLTRTVTQYRDRVQRLPAPVTPAETVFVAALASADTVVRACTVALRTCEQRVADAESVGVAAATLERTKGEQSTVAARLEERAKADTRVAKEQKKIALKVLGAAVALEVVRRSISSRD